MTTAPFALVAQVESVVRDLDHYFSGLLLTVTEEDLAAAEWTAETTRALERLQERLRRSRGSAVTERRPPTPTD